MSLFPPPIRPGRRSGRFPRFFRLPALALLCHLGPSLLAQGYFSGDLQMETQFYIRDTLIGASNTEHYDVLKNGGDAWLSLNYQNPDLDLGLGVRMDAFYNSNLHFPGTAFTGIGIGAFYIQKGVDKLDITGGYLYDQFGSGLTFRAYEERALGIDKAILGLRLRYDFNDSWSIKALAGKQKNRFELFAPIIMGAEVLGNVQLSEKAWLNPGLNVVNRSMDKTNLDLVRANLAPTLAPGDSVLPLSNVYSGSVYNSLDWGDFSWYIEVAGKSNEYAYADGTPFDRWGHIVMSSLTWSRQGLGITGQFRRVDNFELRTSPNEQLLLGIFNFLPSLTRQNSLRLPARYNGVPQDRGEQGFQIDAIYTPKKGYTLTGNFADLHTLPGEKLYREYYLDLEIRTSRKWKLLVGGQHVEYNQDFYENKPGAREVSTITPFAEFLWKFDRRKSIRVEAQYMGTEGDFGSWMYGLVEFNWAPSFSISVADMYNYAPTEKSPGQIHYYTFFSSYTKDANRFYLSYSRQVEGIICTGGVCRFEPAFNGVKFGVTSSF
jgi:hypothetical protein